MPAGSVGSLARTGSPGAPASSDADGPAADPSVPGVPADLRGPALARAALDAARASGRAYTTRPRVAGDGQSLRRRRWSGAGADPRDPQPLGRLVQRLVHDRGWEKQASEARVMRDWASLVGTEIGDKCRPVGLRDAELTLQAESTAWATQLRLLTPKLLARLTTAIGPGVVTKIRVHGPSAPSWKKGRLSVRGRGPRDTYG